MNRSFLWSLLASCLPTAVGCSSPMELAPVVTDCDAIHASVGAVATLETHAHGVTGQARLVDDCTVELTGFGFDGDGLDVRVVLASESDFENFQVISEDLRSEEPYEDQTLTLPLREGMTLDDAQHISIWCVPAGVSFGDGSFQLP